MAKIPIDLGPTYEAVRQTHGTAVQVAERGNVTVKRYAEELALAAKLLVCIQTGIPSEGIDVKAAVVQKNPTEDVVRLSAFPGSVLNSGAQSTTPSRDNDQKEGYTSPKM